ncbi:MAG: AAA family ATPase, partial [Butyricicoccus sp.]|nr:AAA family ATPase [Butyricicoccus sp.]
MEWNDFETEMPVYEDGGRILGSMISAPALVQKDLPPVRFLVDGLLPQGLTLIASPPKYGKSWLVLDLCLAVAAGKPFLGRETEKATCLYLALEDSEVCLKSRILKLLNGDEVPDKLHLTTVSPALGDGLIEELTQAAKAYADLDLVVIDTFQMIR